GLLKGLMTGGGDASERERTSAGGWPGPSTIGREPGSEAREHLRRFASRKAFGLGKLLVPLTLHLVDLTRSSIVFRENSHAYLMQPLAVIRRLALELGRRMADRGALDQPEDI